MSLRTRILLGSSLLVLVPLIGLTLGIRGEMDRRLTAQYTRRVESLSTVIETRIAAEVGELGGRLEALKTALADDNRVRLAVLDGLESQRPYMLDYAGRMMRLMGLSMLQIQDTDGRILSSGHFRNEYDRVDPSLPRLLGRCLEGSALVWIRKPDGALLTFARADSLRLGGRRFTLVAGISAEDRFLADLGRESGIAVSLLGPDLNLSSDGDLKNAFAASGAWTAAAWEGILPPSEHLIRGVEIPYLLAEKGNRGQITMARLLVSHPLAPLHELRRRLDLWLLVALLATVAGTLLFAAWLSSRISRPIRELARMAEGVELDDPTIEFRSERKDEVGRLTRFLARMIDRLRASAERLREAERRAMQGEMARQVNHDIRNGLTPIRNILRHLSQVAREDRERLAATLLEREGSLQSGIVYLENLAANYARLSPRGSRRPCDLNRIARQVVSATAGDPARRVEAHLATPLPEIHADPIAVRRIVENLVRNAVECLGGEGGRVTVATEAGIGPEGRPVVRLMVRDTGCGIDPEELEKIFRDFYSTKEEGAGLGLSIVQRLVADCDGTIEVASEPGEGSCFTVCFPPTEPTTSRESKEVLRGPSG